MKVLFLVLISLFSNLALAKSSIAIIYVDQKTEKSLGEFPIVRSHYATLIKKLSDYKPRYTILKFFFDIKKKEDQTLIKEIKKHNNILTQAYSYQSKDVSQMDISSYALKGEVKKLPKRNTIMFPYPEMAKGFSGIGFVNGIADKDIVKDFEIISNYKGKAYPSLPLVVLEKVLNTKAKISKETLVVGQKKFKLQQDLGMNLKWNKPGHYPSYSMIDVLNDKIDKKKLENKILVVFYDGPKLTKAAAINGFSYNPAEVVANAIDHLLKE